MKTVNLPAALRSQVDGQEILELEGNTIAELIADIQQKHPELGKRILVGEGVLNRSINIYVNEEDIRFLENFDTVVEDKDNIDIVLAIAGG